jgi:cysteine desulfurase
MADREVYLDNSATTRVFPEVVKLMDRIYLEEYGNPSSLHHKGVEAENRIREAKQIFADILKCSTRNIYFTSCGTESDNIALIGGALANQRDGKHIITTRIEHPAILETTKFLKEQGFEITYLPVDANGRVRVADVEAAVRPDTILVSIMHTNNEIGALEPIAQIGEAIKRRNPKTLFHVDAVQGFGKAYIYPKRMHIDLLSASGHKIHAPKGVGLLYIGDGVKVRNILFGGGQQNGMRSGTENVAGIAGMALAAKMIYADLDEELDKLYGLKELFLQEVTAIEGVHVNGLTGRESAPHVISLSIEGVRAEVLLHALEDKGIYVSAGSACSSNRPHISDTLVAIGTPKEFLDSTIRFSTSVMNTEDDMHYTAEALKELLPMLRKYTRY